MEEELQLDDSLYGADFVAGLKDIAETQKETESSLKDDKDDNSFDDIDTKGEQYLDDETTVNHTEEKEEKEDTSDKNEDDEDSEEDSKESEETSQEGFSFDGITEVLNQYGVSEELTEEQKSELTELEGEQQIEKYLQFQNENREANIENKARQLIDESIGSLPEKTRTIIDMVSRGIPEEEAFKLADEQNSLASITEESLDGNEELQKQVIKSYLQSKGESPEEIEERIDFLEAKDKLELTAKRNLEQQKKLLVEQEKQKEQAAKEEFKKRQEMVELNKQEYKVLIDSQEEIIPGKKITKKEKEAIHDSLFKQIKTDKGVFTPLQLARQSNPKAFDMKVAYLEQLGLFKDNSKAWESILKIGGTKQVNSIINQMKSGPKAGKYNAKQPSSKMDALKRAFPLG
jgi:hypothetical protein